jgi:hypothetical protein
MCRMLLAIMAFTLVLTPAYSATEQEALDVLAADLRAGMQRLQRAKAVEQFELRSSLRIAAEERDLQVIFANRTLAADIATATALVVTSEAGPSEARREYGEAIGQAMSEYQQALYQIQNEWSNQWSTISSRAHRDASEVFQQIAQDTSRLQNRIRNAIGGENADMPPVVEPSLLDFSAEAGPIVDVLSALEQAGDEAQARYQADIRAAETVCDEALAAGLGLKAGPEMKSAMRKAITELKVTCLDRHDRYAMEVRSAARHALLEVDE